MDRAPPPGTLQAVELYTQKAATTSILTLLASLVLIIWVSRPAAEPPREEMQAADQDAGAMVVVSEPPRFRAAPEKLASCLSDTDCADGTWCSGGLCTPLPPKTKK
jgi:hypothetical protein